MDYEKDERYTPNKPVVKLYKDYWVTGNGNKLRISEMDSSHIINCIKMLKNWAERESEKINKAAFCVEGSFGLGERAAMSIQRELASSDEPSWEDLLFDEQPCYKQMLIVLEERGIKIEL